MTPRGTQIGIGVAFVAIAAYAAYALFGGANENWMDRAAKAGAVRCLTGSACAYIGNTESKPLLSDSLCAKPSGWHRVATDKPAILLICTDGPTYLYHFGKSADPAGSDEQWTVCAEPNCVGEIGHFTK